MPTSRSLKWVTDRLHGPLGREECEWVWQMERSKGRGKRVDWFGQSTGVERSRGEALQVGGKKAVGCGGGA